VPYYYHHEVMWIACRCALWEICSTCSTV